MSHWGFKGVFWGDFDFSPWKLLDMIGMDIGLLYKLIIDELLWNIKHSFPFNCFDFH